MVDGVFNLAYNFKVGLINNSPKCSPVLVMLAFEVPFVVRCSIAYFMANASSCRVATNRFGRRFVIGTVIGMCK